MTDCRAVPLRRTGAVILASLAIAASPAAARPALEPQHHDSASAPAAAPTVEQAADGGFEWGSAGLGAGAATVICLLAGAGAVGASRRHHRAPRTSSAGVA